MCEQNTATSGKTIKVKLYREENDCFIEVWQIVGTDRFIGRYTRPGRWVRLSDPLGYCEMDYPFHDDTVFIVCDQSGNELFRSRNDDESAEFNTNEQEAHEQWAKYSEANHPRVKLENPRMNFFAHWATGEPAGSLNQWILSFQDPDLYPEARDYPENWLARIEQVGEPEVLSSYVYLGEERFIEKIRYRHLYCKQEWYKYYSGDYYIGSDFDESRVGTMYTKGQARKVLTDAIRSHFPTEQHISFIERQDDDSSCSPCVRQRIIQAENAWEHLAHGIYHRAYIDEAVRKERERSSFYGNLREIRKVYPDCMEDWRIY